MTIYLGMHSQDKILLFVLTYLLLFFQKLLEARAQQHVNWLEDWWLSTAYLGYRDPVTVFSSPGLVFPFRKFCNQNEQLLYAAKTISAALDYKALIDK